MSQCSAITAALSAKGLNETQLASSAGLGAQRVKDILSGNAKPTTQEFNSIASTLGLSNAPASHATATV